MERTTIKTSSTLGIALGVALASGIAISDSGAVRTTAGGLEGRLGIQRGLIVHLGCGDGALVEEFARSGRYAVQGLTPSREQAETGRNRLMTTGVSGNGSLKYLPSPVLPYADRLVNALVVGDPCGVPAREMLRVLVPGGRLLFPAGSGGRLATHVQNGELLEEGDARDGWRTYRRAWPKTIDDWPQYLHGADGNCVARDVEAGVPRALRWQAGPLHSQHHNRSNSMTAMVTAGGRLFYMLDDTPPGTTGMPARWSLFARDAFNGTLLWKKPLQEWGWEAWSGSPTLQGNNGGRFTQPIHVPRTLVTDKDRVFVTLGYGAPVSVLDARTGKPLAQYQETKGCDELVLDAGLLVAAVHDAAPKAKLSAVRSKKPVQLGKRLVAIDTDTGRVLWRSKRHVGRAGKQGVMDVHRELTPVMNDSHVCFATEKTIECLSRQDGRVLWSRPRPDVAPRPTRYALRPTGIVTLVCDGDTLLYSQLEPNRKIDWRETAASLHAYGLPDGKLKWSYPCSSWGWVAEPDVFVIDGLAWVADRPGKHFAGLSMDTGEVERRISTEMAFDQGHHHRCYRNKATQRYLISSFHGVELFSLADGVKPEVRPWVRSACRYGFMPANGLLYNAPDPCGCYPGTKLLGFNALSSVREEIPSALNDADDHRSRLLEGPAFDAPPGGKPASREDWPAFRHDSARSGVAGSALRGDVKPAWTASLGGKPTPPVVADGKVFAGVPEKHVVAALSMTDGRELWRYPAGGAVDSPPTHANGWLYFGSSDGRVYCLRADDGALRWRFDAAPGRNQIMIDGRLESAWPVHGSVIVESGRVYLTAGRSTFLNGGIDAWVLDASTGKVLSRKRLDDRETEFLGRKINAGDVPLGGVGSDILVSDGAALYMRNDQVFKLPNQARRLPRIRPMAGFRDNSRFNRTSPWYWGEKALGDYLVGDGNLACVFQLSSSFGRHADVTFYRLGSGDSRLLAYSRETTKKAHPGGKYPPLWTQTCPLAARAMAVAGDTLCVAGTPDQVPKDDPWRVYEGRGPGMLALFNTADGKPRQEITLSATPVDHGLAVAHGSLFLSCVDGSLVCCRAVE